MFSVELKAGARIRMSDSSRVSFMVRRRVILKIAHVGSTVSSVDR